MHAALAPGARVVLLDNRYAPGSSSPLTEEDAELGKSLKARDRELDAVQHGFIERVTRRMESDPSNAQSYLDLVLIARYVERVGDHAVNIGVIHDVRDRQGYDFPVDSFGMGQAQAGQLLVGYLLGGRYGIMDNCLYASSFQMREE